MTPDDSGQLFLFLVAARTAIIFLFLVVGFRIFGKKELGQLNIYDLAMIMAVANAVQNAMTKGSGRLAGGIISAGTLFFVGWLLSLIFHRWPPLRTQIVGTPTVLIKDGVLLESNLRHELVSRTELMGVLRKHGLSKLHEVHLAILEVDGTVSVIPKKKD